MCIGNRKIKKCAMKESCNCRKGDPKVYEMKIKALEMKNRRCKKYAKRLEIKQKPLLGANTPWEVGPIPTAPQLHPNYTRTWS